VPLYACERCGFTSAAFRNEAAAVHRLEYPDCDGVIRIIFRSEDRYRGRAYTAAPAVAEAAARSSRAGPRAGHPPRRAFAMREHHDRGGTVRLIDLDLDLTAADTLGSRLDELKTAGRAVRLDLSRLTFIDSSGIQALLAALTDARRHGWQLEIATKVSPTVERAAQVVGIAKVLWPEDPNPSRRDPTTPTPTSTP
jgi:anti-sigma B factor antagonist